MVSLTLQSFDPTEAFSGKVAGTQKPARQDCSRQQGSFERVLKAASGREERPEPARTNEKVVAGPEAKARPRVSGDKHPEPAQTDNAGKQVGKTTSRECANRKEASEDTAVVGDTSNECTKVNESRDTSSQDETTTNIKIIAKASEDSLKITITGLPEELVEEVLAILSQQIQTLFTAPAEVSGANVSGESAGSDTGVEADQPLSNFNLKLNVKLQGAASELAKEIQNVIAMIAAISGNAETQASAVKIHLVQLPTPQSPAAEETSDPELPLNDPWSRMNDPWSRMNVQLRETIGGSERTVQKAAQAQTTFAALLSEDLLSKAGVEGNEQIDLSVFAKLRVTVPPESIVTHAVEEPAVLQHRGSDSGSSTSFAEQGASAQSSVLSGSQVPDGSKGASFGSIVADRIAAITEQVAMREKQVDILLRLQTEGGESLLVNLKEQAGKILVNVRSGDERMISLLQSQKETIIRHLEEKHVTATISVSPIGDEDVPRREKREQPRHQWARQEKAFNPYVEASA
jgi:hypothetical protein